MTTNATNASYRIQTLNMSNQTWSTGGTATQADNRNKSHADVLSDGAIRVGDEIVAGRAMSGP